MCETVRRLFVLSFIAVILLVVLLALIHYSPMILVP
jgi:hypothetical protein